jgi:uncharacterized protein YqhQ
MDFDLWTLFIDYLGGSFLLGVLVVAILIYLIVAVFGGLSGRTIWNYLMLFAMAMTLGWGYKWITAIISFALLTNFYMAWKNAHSG